MTLVPLNNIFSIKYGTQLDLNKMTVSDSSSINFVSRSSQNLGIMCQVEKLENKSPLSAGTITVTLGGSYLLSAFIQPSDFYTAQNIKVLIPKEEMSFNEKAFYCLCISSNRYRYSSHGREANTTLDTILVPDRSEVPEWVYTIQFKVPSDKPILSQETPKLNTNKWKSYKLDELFEINSSRDDLMANYDFQDGFTPYITSTEFNNGISAFVDVEPSNAGNVITINRGGSVGEAFYQEHPFLATPVDVRLLIPKANMKLNKYVGLFITTILRNEKYRFNFSRKMGTERLKELSIKLPVDSHGNPDWDYMENYIKTLKYSSSI